MSLFDQQKAPQDTVIQQNVPTQNINVSGPGRFYPEEFSGQIRAVEQQQSNLAEIPKTLASITEHVNDYRISTWAEEERTNINKQNIQNQNALTLREQELDLKVNNSIYDMSEQMDQAITDTLNQADIDDIDKETALAEVLEEYKNPIDFENSPAAKQKWQARFQQKALETMRAAHLSDIETEQYKAKANISHAINKNYAMVIQGNIVDPASAMQNTIGQIAPYLQQIPAMEAQQIINSSWNSLVLARSQAIIDAVEKGYTNPDAGSQELRALLAESTEKIFECRDAQGNVIIGKDGNPVTFTATLDVQTQNQLIRNFNNAKGSGAGDSQTFDLLANFKEEIGYKDFTETGFSPKVASMSFTDLKQKYEKAKYNILNSSASDMKKAERFTELSEAYTGVMTSKYIATLAKASKESIAPILNQAMTKLRNDLKSNTVDWSTYNLEIPIGKESIIFGGAPEMMEDEDFVRLGDADRACRLYWERTLNYLEKTNSLISNGSIGDLLSVSDKDYQAAEQNLIENITASTLTGTVNGILDVNQNGKTNIEQLLKELDEIPKSMGYGYQAVPTSTLEAIFKQFDDPSKFATIYEKQIGKQTFIQAMIDAGHISDFTKYIIRNGGQTDAAKDAMAIFSILNSKDTQLKAEYQTLAKNILDDKDALQNRKNELTTHGLSGTTLSTLENEIYKDLRIPDHHRIWYSELSKRCAYMAVAEGKDAPKKYKEYFKKALVNNYTELKGVRTLNNKQIFKHSPQMRLYNTAQGEEKLKNRLNMTMSYIKNTAANIGISDNIQDLYWCSDDHLQVIRLCDNNGRAFTIDLDNDTGTPETYLGILMSDDSIYAAGDKKVSTLQAQAFMSGLIASNPKLADKLAGKEVLSADKETVLDSLEKPLQNNSIISYYKKLEDTYANDKQSFNKDLLAIARTTNNPIIFKKIALSNKTYITEGGVTEATFYPDNNILKVLGSFGFPSKEARIYRTTLDLYGSRDIYESIEEELGYNYNTTAEIYGNATYAGKVNQNNISTPVTQAALGNSSYIDVYNISNAAGFKISNTVFPGAIYPTYSNMTLFKTSLTGSRSSVPQSVVRTYTPNEIEQMTEYYANMWGIPTNIAKALVIQESGGNPNAVSKAGATGVTQLMPATAKELGVTNSKDPAQNIWGGMKYLSTQYKKFKDWSLALAAYNAGPGNVLKHKGIPPFKETQNYVKNILSKSGMNNTKEYTINYSISDNSRKFINQDTNMLSIKNMQSFINMLNTKEGFKNKVQYIYTNRPELLENKVEYSDYSSFRQLKNKDGKSLFRKGNYDGFSIQLEKDNISKDGLDIASIPALADDAALTQTDIFNKVSRNEIEALINTFADNFSTNNIGREKFGLANLTADEYESYGIPVAYMNNPIMQSRVLTQEYQRAIDILGSSNKAVYALAGGSLISNNNEIKSWSEIKQDKESFRKTWYIKPSNNDKERSLTNALVAQYNKNYNRLRGLA